ncbi:hypothetical protein G3567_04010 [Psychroflexus sp. YR1-1]|uniref:Beta-lactamase-inhibitor-like, PepSY-like n=1 Tax=Psychroflexus aurantiacus TaxID=2709310 RepID=A0A6B3R3C6_9FLAO|nr:hypothetical protein [Psychroflexus aurantiacus]NEV93315.1 hypothetical protein [Psychroflexus aurantiacus]
MNETFDITEDLANFTSAGTSHLTLNTSRGLEEVEIENITQLDSDYKTSDLGQLYADFPDNFIKIQKITFRNQTFFNCYFTTEERVSILKFDSEGELLGEKHL